MYTKETVYQWRRSGQDAVNMKAVGRDGHIVRHIGRYDSPRRSRNSAGSGLAGTNMYNE